MAESKYGGIFDDTPQEYGGIFSTPTTPVQRVEDTSFAYDFADIPAYNDLSQHEPWLRATETVYNMGKNEQTRWKGTDEELAQYGIEHMSWFNSNFSLGMSVDAVKLASASPEQKEAFLYLMETYDEIDEPNLPAMGRFAKGFLLDPLTYVGLTTFGVGLGVKEVGKQTTKQGLKELLKQGIKRGGVVGAAEGSIYGFADTSIRENIRVGGGAQDSVDFGNILKGTGLGTVAGFTLGTVADAGITNVTNKLTRKSELEKLKAERLQRLEKTDPKTTDEATDAPKLKEQLDSRLDNKIDDFELDGASKGSIVTLSPKDFLKSVLSKKEYDDFINGNTGDDVSPFVKVLLKQKLDVENFSNSGELHLVLNGSKIVGHEGRHRMAALYAAGYDQVPVIIRNQGGRFKTEAEVPASILGQQADDIQIELGDSLLINSKNKDDILNLDTFVKTTDEAPVAPSVQDVDGMLIDIPYFNTALTAPLRNLESIATRAQELIPEVIKMTPARFVRVAEQIRNSELTVESRSNIDQVVQGVRDHFLREQETLINKWAKATTPEEKLRLRGELSKAEAHLSQIDDLDADLRGAAGMSVKQRDNIFISGKGYTLDELKEEFPDLSDAELLFKQRDAIAEGRAKNRIKQVEFEYDQKMTAALENKDPATYLKLNREKRQAVDKIIDEEGKATANDPKGWFKHHLYEGSARAVEITISNVFSVSTLLLNVGFSSLKTLYRPALDFAIGGKLNKQAYVEMMAGYAGLRSMRSSALKAAMASFKYEKQVATFETNKMFDENIKIKGKLGAVLRTFPRLLLASDSFLQDINYRGFVSSKATADAYEEGLQKGLKGSELDNFVKAEVKTKLDASYDTSMRKETIDAVYRKGVAKKLKGEELDNWVAESLAKDESGLFSYNDQGGLDYSNDVLFKKEFSGKGLLSGGAAKYEKMVREWPVAKLFLNLFWRTPVRVFEEGIRLTPVLNVASTQKFRDDLIGRNGNRAQLRARGEMLLGQAVVMDTMVLMSSGGITGANDPEHPYSIKMPDGSWWSYKLADPLSTPIKIIANTMENYQILLLRQQQEGITDNGALEQFWDDNYPKFQAALIGITTTISDARLLQGFSDAYEGVFGESGLVSQAVNDPTDEDKPVITKKFFDMLGAAFPRQIYKLYEFEDPTRYQTASLDQVFRKQALPYYSALEEYADPLLQQLGVDLDIDNFKAKLTPSFDVNGMPITNPDPMASNLIFSATKEEEFRAGLNENQIYNREKLHELGINANTFFYHPYRYRKGYGDEDLRTLYAPATDDRPEESYMSRWMYHYRQLAPEGEIREILEDTNIATGIPSNSPKVNEIRSIMRSYKEDAWEMLAEEVPDVMDRLEEKDLIDEAVDEGLFDTIQN